MSPSCKNIVLRSARVLDVTIDDDAAEEIARRSRGTPRIGNRLLRRVRDYAQVRPQGHISLKEATTALDMLEVDRFGLDEIDQKIMMTVLEKYSGGPVGLNTISASIDEEASTIEEVYEPYLMQLGFLGPDAARPHCNRSCVRIFRHIQADTQHLAARSLLSEDDLSLARIERGRSGEQSANRNRHAASSRLADPTDIAFI